MKTTNQNYTTPPRSKRCGFIRLGLLCLLSAFVAPMQSFAQGVPTVNPDELTYATTVTRQTGILVDWHDIRAVPSKAKNGSVFTFTGRLLFSQNGGGTWRPLGNRTVIIRAGGDKAAPVAARTDAQGNVIDSQNRIGVRICIRTPNRIIGSKNVPLLFEFAGDNTYRGTQRGNGPSSLKNVPLFYLLP